MSLAVQIRRAFPGFTLDVEFETGVGTLGILGPSGSGKSMTLRCIAGMESPDSGRISLNGRALFDSHRRVHLSPQKRSVGYLFQSYALFPHMTVSQNIACGMRGKRAGEAKAIEGLLRRFALTGLGDRFPGQLSGGQQQRAALARIWASSPEALLLDEPFSALDAHLKESLHIQMQGLLREYPGDAVLVTHNRDEAYTLCARLLIIEEGRVCAHGDTKALFQNPGTLAAARLTGCKNISRARRISANRLFATDWGCELAFSKAAPERLDFVGVRAHDFVPCARADGENALSVAPAEIVDTPFEWSLLFRNAANPAQDAPLWWKRPKDGNPPVFPPALRVPPECVLPLENTSHSG